jgi:hypothetical protein
MKKRSAVVKREVTITASAAATATPYRGHHRPVERKTLIMKHAHRLSTRPGGQHAAGVGPDTPIAHLGLDSPAVSVANTLGHEFGVACPSALLLDGSTVADLAAVLASGQPTQHKLT